VPLFSHSCGEFWCYWAGFSTQGVQPVCVS